MPDHEWPAELGGGIKADPIFARALKEIYNRYAGNAAYVLYRIVNYFFEEQDEALWLKPMGHVCYLWKLDDHGKPDAACYLIDVKFHDSGLLLELIVPYETVPTETIDLFGRGREVQVPVFRRDEPLPEHPAVGWFMEVVRQLEEPPLLEVHAQLAKEMASEYIWGVCEEIARGLAHVAAARQEPFPRPLPELEADLDRLAARFTRAVAATGITRLNMQADLVCLAAQILLQKYAPEDDLRWPWMGLLNGLGRDVLPAILAARAKAAFLAAHPELATLPNDTGFSLSGPMQAVGLAIREAIRRGVYQ